MEKISHSGHGVIQNTLITLSIEVLVYICSFLSVRDVVKIRCVSKILRYVGETPSLWRTFIWSIYPPRDSELLEHILKMFGQHIRQFHFADVPPSKLEVMLKFCKNVTHLSLPRFTYYNEILKLEKIVCSMSSLQILDIQSCIIDSAGHVVSHTIRGHCVVMQNVFKLASNLKELSIYLRSIGYRPDSSLENATHQWIKHWAKSNYVPRKLNLVVTKHVHFFLSEYLSSVLPVLKERKLSNILDLPDVALLSICFKASTNFVSVVPYIQVQVTDSSVTFPELRLDLPLADGLSARMAMHLSQGSHHGKKFHKALLNTVSGDAKHVDNSITCTTSLASVTYVDLSSNLLPEHLEWLSIACPNLQRLDLSGNDKCLRNLKGLRSVAENCKKLQSLNLKRTGSITYYYSYVYTFNLHALWEILFVMHLTELSIENSMFTDGIENMFQNYFSLQALEVVVPPWNDEDFYCLDNDTLLLLSYFPSITYCKLDTLCISDPRGLKQIFSCRYLWCLLLEFSDIGKDILSLSLEGQCSCLQELYIDSDDSVLTDTFINTLCAHGGLEHVILCINSLTARSITNLIEHSPNLMIFETYLCSRSWTKVQLKYLTAQVRTRFYNTKLIDGGLFRVSTFEICHEHRSKFLSRDPWIS